MKFENVTGNRLVQKQSVLIIISVDTFELILTRNQ